MIESDLYNEFRAIACRYGYRLFRNNTGFGEMYGRKIRFGLCKGSADLIGLHIGTARFVAIEVKLPGKKPTREQVAFLKMVHDAGGLAAVITTKEELEKLFS